MHLKCRPPPYDPAFIAKIHTYTRSHARKHSNTYGEEVKSEARGGGRTWGREKERGGKKTSLGLKTQRTESEREVRFSIFPTRVSKIGSGREQQLDNAISIMILGGNRYRILPYFFLDPSTVACVVTCEYNLWRVAFCKHRLLCVYLGFEGNKTK